MEAIIAGAVAVFILLSPFINAGIQNVTWTPKQKALLAWGVSIVLALIFLFVTGGVSALTNIFIAAPTVYGYQQAIYTFLIKNIATKFEAITTPGSIVVSPSSVTPGTVDITSDVTQANPTGHQLEVDPPVAVVTSPEPVKESAKEPVTIVKDDNVVG